MNRFLAASLVCLILATAGAAWTYHASPAPQTEFVVGWLSTGLLFVGFALFVIGAYQNRNS